MNISAARYGSWTADMEVFAMSVVSFDLHKAREMVKQAKNALKAAEREYDDDCSYGHGNLRLIAKVRSAERRLHRAQEELRRLDAAASAD